MAREFAVLTSDDLITGEAVALDLPAAGVGTRLVSGLIDVAVVLVATLIMTFVIVVAGARVDEALAGAIMITLMVTTLVIYPATLETLTRGRSLGKLAMGLRTVRDDAGPITFHHALIRALIGVVEIYILSGVPAFFSMLLSSRGKRLGDYAAGTYVVRMRVPAALNPPAPMPPHLAGWAAGADITSLPVGLALAVRQFLSRSRNLDPANRTRIAVTLADEVSPHVSPLPPTNTHPEDFLMAVIAARRERDLARLRREADFRGRLVGRA